MRHICECKGALVRHATSAHKSWMAHTPNGTHTVLSFMRSGCDSLNPEHVAGVRRFIDTLCHKITKQVRVYRLLDLQVRFRGLFSWSQPQGCRSQPQTRALDLYPYYLWGISIEALSQASILTSPHGHMETRRPLTPTATKPCNSKPSI